MDEDIEWTVLEGDPDWVEAMEELGSGSNEEEQLKDTKDTEGGGGEGKLEDLEKKRKPSGKKEMSKKKAQEKQSDGPSVSSGKDGRPHPSKKEEKGKDETPAEKKKSKKNLSNADKIVPKSTSAAEKDGNNEEKKSEKQKKKQSTEAESSEIGEVDSKEIKKQPDERTRHGDDSVSV